MNAKYDSYKEAFYKKCTLEFTKKWIENIKILQLWIKEYIHSIRHKYNIKQALLFGSFAKGNYHEDSDIDIAIVIKNVSDIIDTQIELMKLRRKIDLRIEPHPFKERSEERRVGKEC